MGDEMTVDDYVPVKDNFENTSKNLVRSTKFSVMDDSSATNRLLQQRRVVSKIQRDELEDKFLRIHEENILLKKHARKQEDKIKRMATKLLRLINDRKKMEQEGGTIVKRRDIESEEMIEDMQNKITDLTRQNSQLKDKLMVLKQQLAMQSQRPSAYSYVQSRINTGIPKPEPRLLKGMRVTGFQRSNSSSRQDVRSVTQYDESILEELRGENKNLEEVVESLQGQIVMYEQDIVALKNELKENEKQYEDELLKIKSRVTADQRLSIQENMDLLRLQREVKEKGTKLTAIQDQYASLEENFKSLKSSHDQIFYQMETLNNQLKEEQNKCLSLKNDLKNGTTTHRTLVELQERFSDLQNENHVLKEANEKLLNSAFDLDRERLFSTNESALKIQIAQLEATIKAELREKEVLLDKLGQEKAELEKLQQDFQDVQIAYFSVKEQLENVTKKINFLNKENITDYTELEEALILIKQKQESSFEHDLSFLGKIEDETKDFQHQLTRLQAEHADTILELEKTRNMLIMQHKINKDYQTEVESVTLKMEDLKTEYETKFQEYAQLADIRASRIRKLEKQLRDVAYGTKQYKIKDGSDEELEIDESIQLERGQNLFEIHISKIIISPEGLRAIEDEEPTTFATWEFYDFEIQATPVVKGHRPEFDFTSQYIVKVDDFFLHYLQKETTLCEFHQAFGTDYRTLASCHLKFKEIFDRLHGRIHGKIPLLGTKSGIIGLCYGTLEYWIRLCVPIDQALRLFKERTKALGYLSANDEITDQALEILETGVPSRSDDSLNELHIKVICCSGLQGRRKDVQPSPYIMYKFYDFDDHDTRIIPNSNNPEFNNHRSYPVAMDSYLDSYLKSQVLRVYVFDDADTKEGSYLGLASIPLIPLSYDKEIKGTFELKQSDGSLNGSLDIVLYWQYTYLAPGGLSGMQKSIPLHRDKRNKKDASQPMQPKNLELKLSKSISNEMTIESSDKSLPVKPSISEPSILDFSVKKKPPIPSTRTKKINTNKNSLSSQQIFVNALDHNSLISDNIPVPAPRVSSDQISLSDDKLISEIVQEKDLPPNEIVQHQDNEQYSIVRTKHSTQQNLETTTASINEEEVPEDVNSIKDKNSDISVESDNDEVVIFPVKSTSSLNQSSNTVVIVVSHLRLLETSRIMNDTNVQMLFVEYQFLGYPPEELEVPFSLPKPKPNSQSFFNFRKVFFVDSVNNYEYRQFLASMILPNSPDQGKIKFTVVSEPLEDAENKDCDDVGYAYGDLIKIMKENNDIIDQDIEIYDAKDESVIIGFLNVSIEALSALTAIRVELQL